MKTISLLVISFVFVSCEPVSKEPESKVEPFPERFDPFGPPNQTKWDGARHFIAMHENALEELEKAKGPVESHKAATKVRRWEEEIVEFLNQYFTKEEQDKFHFDNPQFSYFLW